MVFVDVANIASASTTASTDVPRNESLWMAGYWNNGHSSMNPFIGTGNDYSGVFFMYLPLFDTNSQVYSDYLNPTNLVPLLGSDASWSSDGSQLTVNLRPQAKWSDGTAVTSADVVFSLQAYTGMTTDYGSTGIFQGDLKHQIASITAPSTTQVVITLKSGYYHSEAVYEDLLIGGAPIVPKAVFSGKDNNFDNNWFTNSNVTSAMKIVDGPYKPYATSSDGSTAINVRVDNWWMVGITDSHNEITWREPEPTYIVSYGTPNNFDQDTALANGQIDLFGSYVANVGSLINGSTKLNAWFEGSGVTQFYPLTSAMNEVVFNYNYYPLDQTWFHKALASAIDYNSISHVAASDYLQQASATWLDSNQPAMRAYYNASLAQKWAITASVTQAKTYMQQGAYQKNGAWYTLDATPDLGKTYAFTNQTIVSTPGVNTATQIGDMDPNHAGINLLIGGKNQGWYIYCVDGWTDHMASLNIISQNWLNYLNVSIKYETKDYGTVITNRGVVNADGSITRNYGMYYSSLGNKLDASPINFFQYFTGTTDQSRNVTNWVNPSFAGNLTAYSTSTSEAAQKQYINNLQDLLGEYMPSIPVAVNCYWYLYSDVYWQGWPNGHNEVAGKYTATGEYASRSDYVPVTTHWTTDHFGHDLMILNNLVKGPGPSSNAPWDFSSIVIGLSAFAITTVVIRKRAKRKQI